MTVTSPAADMLFRPKARGAQMTPDPQLPLPFFLQISWHSPAGTPSWPPIPHRGANEIRPVFSILPQAPLLHVLCLLASTHNSPDSNDELIFKPLQNPENDLLI